MYNLESFNICLLIFILIIGSDMFLFNTRFEMFIYACYLFYDCYSNGAGDYISIQIVK